MYKRSKDIHTQQIISERFPVFQQTQTTKSLSTQLFLLILSGSYTIPILHCQFNNTLHRSKHSYPVNKNYLNSKNSTILV